MIVKTMVTLKDVQEKDQQTESVMDRLMAGTTIERFRLKDGMIIDGTITNIGPDNVLVDIGGKTYGRIPASQFANQRDELSVGDAIKVLVVRSENREGEVELSYEAARQQENWKVFCEQYKEGSIISGRIKSVIKGGFVMDIGVDAFLPSSQVGLTETPKHCIGQIYDVKVVKINRSRHNVIVSHRELLEEQHREKMQEIWSTLKVGDVLRGKVKNITDYGVFVDLGTVDGMVYVKDIAWDHVAHPNEKLKVGEEIDVKVIGLDTEKERIALGIKQLFPNPWEQFAKRYPVGAKVSGVVSNVTANAAFVKVSFSKDSDGAQSTEATYDVSGFVPASEISWSRCGYPGSVLKTGDPVDAIVIETNPEEQKIVLSVKQTTPNPWESVRNEYPVGARVHGEVINLTSYGAFVKLEEGIVGMVHVSDMSWTRKINQPSDLLKVGEVIDVVVLSCDPSQGHISLGLKQLQEDPWEYLSYHVGDRVKGKIDSVTNAGWRVELNDGILGLLRKKDDLAFTVGDEVELYVSRIDKNERHLDLSTDHDEPAAPLPTVKQNTQIGDAFEKAMQQKQLNS